MNCWGIVEDLKLLCENVLESDMSKDSIANILIGMEELYGLKFEKLFSLYEQMLKER